MKKAATHDRHKRLRHERDERVATPTRTFCDPEKMDPSSSSSASQQPPFIPIEIISEEEMAFFEAALASTRPVLSSMLSRSIPYSTTGIRSCTNRSTKSVVKDIEESCKLTSSSKEASFLQRFRARRALMVTDITSSEWCEKQTEFKLTRGKPKRTAAMKAGSDRHTVLEKEVIDKVEIRTETPEDVWALKFFNFIVGAKQLMYEGLTRELPVIGAYGDTWIFGVIDELRMPLDESVLNPVLIDTKTRYKATLPTEAQRRNSRLQLMCYKYLWDGLVADAFSTEHFLDYFGLNPKCILSKDINQYAASLGFNTKTFDGAIKCFRDSSSFLSPSQDQLTLRYELQSDCSLLEAYEFAYDEEWLKEKLEDSLSFWTGKRQSKYVLEDETWKCSFCTFNTHCPMMMAKSISETT